MISKIVNIYTVHFFALFDFSKPTNNFLEIQIFRNITFNCRDMATAFIFTSSIEFLK